MNAEEFQLYAEIDYLYYELGKIVNGNPRTPIEIMIDEACGYTDEKIGKDALRIIGMIINRKRKLGINVTDSVKSLRKLKIELKEIYKNEK